MIETESERALQVQAATMQGPATMNGAFSSCLGFRVQGLGS